MKKIALLLSIFSLVGLIGCGSKTVKEEGTQTVEVIKTQPDFVILEASAKHYPKWLKTPAKGDKAKLRKKYRYFVNSSEHANKRLCLKSAEVRATAHIAGEIAQFIKNTYAEATQGGGDEDVSEYMQEQLAQEIQSFIVGARVLKTFWEKRKYMESLGAEEDMVIYNCSALVRMSKKNLRKAVKAAQAKILYNTKDPEVKKKTNKILKDVGTKFAELDHPVVIEKED